MAEIIDFPKTKRVQKAIVVAQIDAEWFSVCILPSGPRDGELYGVLGAGGADFGDHNSALDCAIEAYDAWGRAAGLLLVDAVGTSGGTA